MAAKKTKTLPEIRNSTYEVTVMSEAERKEKFPNNPPPTLKELLERKKLKNEKQI